MKVFITRIIPDAGLQLLRDAGYALTQYAGKKNLSQQELIDGCQSHDALLSSGPNNLDAHFFASCRHLKVVSLLSAGYDQADIAAATRLGIPVGHTPGVLSQSTADVAFLLMIAVSRNAFYLHHKIERGEWGFFEPTANVGIELYGKTLGIFGLGKIGLELARKCAAVYRMRIIYHNRSRNEAAERELSADRVTFDELLRQSDVLSIHANLSGGLRGLFDKAVFRKMKPSAIFINTARGVMHNEQDLIEALQQQVIWGAGLDVTNPEPMAKDNPLLTMPHVCVLPHIGTGTIETRSAMAILAARNIIAALKGERMPHTVNPEVYDHLPSPGR